MRNIGVVTQTGAKGFLAVWEKAIGIHEPVFHAMMRSIINQQTGSGADLFPAQIATDLRAADIMAKHDLARPNCFDDPRMARLALVTVPTDGAADNRGPSDSIESSSGKADGVDVATTIIAEALVQKVADMLQMEASDVEPHRPSTSYGVDSLAAIEVRNWISREMKANIPLLDILAAVPMDKLAAKIAQMTGRSSNST